MIQVVIINIIHLFAGQHVDEWTLIAIIWE